MIDVLSFESVPMTGHPPAVFVQMSVVASVLLEHELSVILYPLGNVTIAPRADWLQKT
jgi:hypothetical protein